MIKVQIIKLLTNIAIRILHIITLQTNKKNKKV